MSEPISHDTETVIKDHESGSEDHKDDSVVITVKGVPEHEAYLREELAREKQALRKEQEEVKRLQKLVKKQAKEKEAQRQRDQLEWDFQCTRLKLEGEKEAAKQAIECSSAC